MILINIYTYKKYLQNAQLYIFSLSGKTLKYESIIILELRTPPI